MGENVSPWLQHMGALRPDLSIEAMIKIKMEAEESEVMGPYEHRLIAIQNRQFWKWASSI